jgi:hypothetical protein
VPAHGPFSRRATDELRTIGYRLVMTTTPQEPDHVDQPDQDAEPPSATGEEPDAAQLDEATAEPASHPDPDPDAGPQSEND